MQNKQANFPFAADSCRHIGIFDTSISSDNLGDQIIMRGIYREVKKIAPDYHLWPMATHDSYRPESEKKLKDSRFTLFGGTNILSNNFPYQSNWVTPKVPRSELLNTLNNKIIFTAVGFNCGEPSLTEKAGNFLKAICYDKMPVSCRDIETVKALSKVLGDKVLHTSCVTLWDLDLEKLSKAYERKCSNVCVTLTDYCPDPKHDYWLLNFLKSHYENIFFWPQGASDLAYFESLNVQGIEVIGHSLGVVERLLQTYENLEHVGTRLHCGILFMQYNHKALVLGVDNRAGAISQSVNLPVVDRGDHSEIINWSNNGHILSLDLPRENIHQWRQLFAAALK